MLIGGGDGLRLLKEPSLSPVAESIGISGLALAEFPDGFLRSFSAMENLVKQLIDAGLVKPRDGEQPDSTPVVDKEAKSPNF